MPFSLKKNTFTVIKEWLLVTLGILIYVGGWSIFLIPNNLVGGGVSGISSMIQYATGGAIQMGYSYFVLNAILIIAAIVVIGMGFGAKTIYAIILASIGLRFLPGVFPTEIIQTLALQNGKLMSTLCGGLMAGIGIGMSISNGGSTGGTDIIALIYTKYRNVSPGKVILYLDFIIILSSLLIPSIVPDLDPETGKQLLGADGLQIQLQAGANPVMLVQEGALILQAPETTFKKDGFVFWTARPDGIYTRNWVKPSEENRTFDKFVDVYEPGSKKIISGAQTFHLRPVVRELIVVADETEFYTNPSENAQVVKRLVFGDRLVSLDLVGLYRKVQFDNRVGYVNRRAVSFLDELSSVQIEHLKQVDKERGETLQDGSVPNGSMLESLYEDRIIYSSFGRRDPFVEIKGLVEEGINIDQVELVGIIWESEVPMAILVESKNPTVSYTIKEGDKILNGKVLKITQTDVLFLIQEFGVSRRYSMGLPDKFGGQK